MLPAEKRCTKCGEPSQPRPSIVTATARMVFSPAVRCAGRTITMTNGAEGAEVRLSPRHMLRMGREIPRPPVEQTEEGPIILVPLAPEGFAVIDADDWVLVAEQTGSGARKATRWPTILW